MPMIEIPARIGAMVRRFRASIRFAMVWIVRFGVIDGRIYVVRLLNQLNAGL